MDQQALKRFEKYVSRQPDGCWLWIGSSMITGYGVFGIPRALGERPWKMHMAHRVAYEHWKGSIPDGLEIDHLCRVHNCVNPDHLEPVTGRINVLRGEGLAARNARQTHCLRGHVLAGSNIYLIDGHRRCKECYLIRQRIRRARLRVEKIGA